MLNPEKLQETVEVCREFLSDRSGFEEGERNYKLKIASRIREVLRAVEDGSDLHTPLGRAFGKPNNLTDYRAHDPFRKWVGENPEAGRRALESFTRIDLSPEERVDRFFEHLPESISGFGTRLMLASFFLFGSDPEHLVPFRATAFDIAERLLGWPDADPGLSPGEAYAHHLRFVKELEGELRAAGLDVRDTLDAQGLMWWLTKSDDPLARRWREELDRLWWVNQGESYAEERDGGFIHAPMEGETGRSVAHWKNVSHVQPGDLILHHAAKALRAISQVEAAAEPNARPVGHPDRSDGYLVLTRYSELPQSIPLGDLPLEWRTEEGGPFDKNGNVRQGYLFPLSTRFRQRFLERFAGALPPEIDDRPLQRGDWRSSRASGARPTSNACSPS
jgi:hypothetical protein